MASTQYLKPNISISSSSFIHHPPLSTSSSQISLKPHKDHKKLNFTPKFHTFNTANPTLSRRLFLPSVSGIWDALTGNNNNNAREAVSDVECYYSDRVMFWGPWWSLTEQLSWILGKRFEEGADQFRLDIAQNPNDTEESIWCFLCESQLFGVDGARKRFLEVGRDPRSVMREAYNMFKDGGDAEKLVAAFSSAMENEYFYASLYAGLYYEAQKNADAAKVHMLAACQSPYGQRSDDYMASLAKVHCICRKWSSD